MLTFDIVVCVLSAFLLISFGIGIYKMSSEDMRKLKEKYNNQKNGDKEHSHG
jgi:hypothetical protein